MGMLQKLMFKIGLIASCLVVMVAGNSGATSVVSNPGEFKATITNGLITVGSFSGIHVPESQAFGTVDADGNISIPTNGIAFPIATISTFKVTLTPSGPWTGQIDPSTGEVAIRVRVYIEVISPVSCKIGPVDINRATTKSAGGTSYNAASGTFSIASNSFAVPEVSSAACGAVSGPIQDLI